MALSDEQIFASDTIMGANAVAGLPMLVLGMLARTIEAEVRKQDTELIRQMRDALRHARTVLNHHNLHQLCGPVNEALPAANARLEGT